MRAILLGIFLAFVAGVIYFSITLGAFKDVHISEGPYHELKVIYKDHVGPYHKIGDVIKTLEEWAKSHQVECKITFGQYLDNPQVVEHERLRSRGGCVVSEFPSLALPPDARTMVIPERNYFIAKFEGSPWIGPYKVYNKVSEIAAERRIEIKDPIIELYEMISEKKMQTTYLFPKP